MFTESALEKQKMHSFFVRNRENTLWSDGSVCIERIKSHLSPLQHIKNIAQNTPDTSLAREQGIHDVTITYN